MTKSIANSKSQCVVRKAHQRRRRSHQSRSASMAAEEDETFLARPAAADGVPMGVLDGTVGVVGAAVAPAADGSFSSNENIDSALRAWLGCGLRCASGTTREGEATEASPPLPPPPAAAAPAPCRGGVRCSPPAAAATPWPPSCNWGGGGGTACGEGDDDGCGGVPWGGDALPPRS
jgi:hypothetical protein